MKPSASAILIPADNCEGVLALVDHAFRSRGFVSFEDPIPAGYPLRRDEWFDFGVRLQPDANSVLVLPSDVDAVFRVSVVLSATLGEVPIVAFRRFMGMAPVLKFYLGGKPKWRDGQDKDHECKYEVPTTRPSGIVTPEEHGLPGSASDMERAVGAHLKRYEAARRDPGAGFVWRSYLNRRSTLYKG